MNIYVASPLFSQAEVKWNRGLADALAERGHTVFLPQETAKPFIAGNGSIDVQAIFSTNCADIDRADAIVAVLEGSDVDSGTAWEVGYAYAKGKPIVGLRTDFRSGEGDGPVNMMLFESIAYLLRTSHDESLSETAALIDGELARSRNGGPGRRRSRSPWRIRNSWRLRWLLPWSRTRRY